MSKTKTVVEPEARQDLLDLLADTTDEEAILAGADQLEATSDELELAQQVHDQAQADEANAAQAEDTVISRDDNEQLVQETPKKARKITLPDKELEPMLASSAAHALTEPKVHRVYFANVDTADGASRSWAVIIEGKQVGELSARLLDGAKHYLLDQEGEERLDFGTSKNAARDGVALAVGGKAYWGS
jgi:hypothetical protein